MALNKITLPSYARAARVGAALGERTRQRAHSNRVRYYDAATASSIELELIERPRPLSTGPVRDPRVLSIIATRFNSPNATLRELSVLSDDTGVSMSAADRGPSLPGPLRARLPAVRVFATESFAIGHADRSVARWLASRGARAIGERGAWRLYLAPPDDDPMMTAFEFAHQARRLGALNAHPNFVRLVQRPANAPSALPRLWNHAMIGVADTHQLRHGRGRSAIRVAILDEGVDDQHPALAPAIVASRDFIDGAPSAMPSGNDAHGTACAGIIASRDPATPGIAPRVSLVAARIAKDDGAGNWVMDDFQTADAIEWSWRTARADVLSCSWRLGIPVDVITDAFNDARTRGRGGKGTIIVVAAGNDEGPIQFPGTLSGPLVVGASNGNDERKTRTTNDGEPHWGSSHGPTLGLLAPGIGIATTDICGARGYTSDDFHNSFNGTSSAAPHVAAAAAILVSIAPKLTESQIKRSILRTARKLRTPPRWTPTEGHGRLDLHAAARWASSERTKKRNKNATLTGTRSARESMLGSVRRRVNSNS